MAALEEFNPEATEILRDLEQLSTTVLARDGAGPRITGFSTPYNFDTELNKIWAVSTGRGSLRWWGLQLVARQGRLNNQQLLRAMLDDPQLGRDLIDIVKTGKKPNPQKLSRMYDTFITYVALDIYRYNDEENSGGIFVPLAEATLGLGELATDYLFSETTKKDPRVNRLALPTTYSQRSNQIRELTGAAQ